MLMYLISNPVVCDVRVAGSCCNIEDNGVNWFISPLLPHLPTQHRNTLPLWPTVQTVTTPGHSANTQCLVSQYHIANMGRCVKECLEKLRTDGTTIFSLK